MAETLPDALAEVKKTLRAEVLARRDRLAPALLAEKSQQIFDQVAGLPEYQAARTVFCYATFGSELLTFPFMKEILASGRRLVMSRIVSMKNRQMNLYEVRDLNADLEPGPFGIRQPDPAHCPQVPPAIIDFILMPGTAFDAQGGRMGYGAGFYDTLVASYGDQAPPLVAAALDLQLVDSVPMAAHDQRMDVIVTESAIYRLQD